MSYVDEVLERVKAKNASEPEFLQAVEEVLESLVINPRYTEFELSVRLS